MDILVKDAVRDCRATRCVGCRMRELGSGGYIQGKFCIYAVTRINVRVQGPGVSNH